MTSRQCRGGNLRLRNHGGISIRDGPWWSLSYSTRIQSVLLTAWRLLWLRLRFHKGLLLLTHLLRPSTPNLAFIFDVMASTNAEAHAVFQLFYGKWNFFTRKSSVHGDGVSLPSCTPNNFMGIVNLLRVLLFDKGMACCMVITMGIVSALVSWRRRHLLLCRAAFCKDLVAFCARICGCIQLPATRWVGIATRCIVR